MQVVKNKGVLSLWNGLTANTIKVQFHFYTLFLFALLHYLRCSIHMERVLVLLYLVLHTSNRNWNNCTWAGVWRWEDCSQWLTQKEGLGRGTYMESNVQCVVRSRNDMSKVSKVCLWDSMLHSPISAANVMIAVCYFTYLTPMWRNIDHAFINSQTRAQPSLCSHDWGHWLKIACIVLSSSVSPNLLPFLSRLFPTLAFCSPALRCVNKFAFTATGTSSHLWATSLHQGSTRASGLTSLRRWNATWKTGTSGRGSHLLETAGETDQFYLITLDQHNKLFARLKCFSGICLQ